MISSGGAVQLGLLSGSLIGCDILFCLEGSGAIGLSIDPNDLLNSKAYFQLSGAFAAAIGIGGVATSGRSFGKSPTQLESGFSTSSSRTVIGFVAIPWDVGGPAGSYAVDYANGAISAGGFLGAGLGVGGGVAMGERGALNFVTPSLRDFIALEL
ncbi:hypothetical protein [Microbulbifer sp. A4B17]|uniref:hypothetical protein n=1 Tax=Microbulbifer sp. A4B17 TaxID=359370 RepID=UPI001300B6F7|nr:hypothetical protein [Microbulbifer sp. A4B17]